MAWWEGRMTAFDCETTGVDPETDRIVTAAHVFRDGAVTRPTTWLLNPRVEISDGATEVHGITTAHAFEHGQDAAVGIGEIVTLLGLAIGSQTPLVIYNAPFDLTMVDREARRYGIEPPAWEHARVIDPLVIGKWLDRFRRGSRKLTAACAHYGVALDENDAHGAEADALAALRLAWVIGAKANYVAREQHQIIQGRSQWKRIRADLDQLHEAQAVWARNQAIDLRDYFERQGNHDAAATVREDWPLVPYVEAPA